MSKRQTWFDQLRRYCLPLIVVAIGLYGTWDLVAQPLIGLFRVEQPVDLCATQVYDVAVFKPSSNPNQPPKRVQSTAGLPIIVPAAEQRLLSVDIENPDQKSAMYQWRATYGQFDSRITIENQSVYTAPLSLVNDTITVEATLQGCSPTKRTLELAIIPSTQVPSTNQPIPDQPLPNQPIPNQPLPDTIAPSPTPTLPPTSLPTVTPQAPPRF
ncbi:MAG: hypothetical protein NW220_15085 [Leptolyngbyaceae cyanobacterium bins.349]|nr:hypothetical protein [Leptolyngbyaceae cyanobacterium bins.349]